MRFSYQLRSLILSAGIVLMQSGAGTAAILDLDGLGAPQAPAPREAVAIPELSPSLNSAARQALAAALAAVNDGRPAEAEAAARSVTESHPDAPEGWYMLGVALAGLNRVDEALAALDEAAARYTVNAEPLVYRGDLLLALGRRDEATAAWAEAGRRDPTNWRAQERLAALDEAAGDRRTALQRYQTAIDEGAVDRLYPRLQAARLSLLLGEPARVEALLGAEAGREDADALALDYLARAKVGLDKLDEAGALFDRLIARGDSPRPFIAKARLYTAEGRIDEAGALMAQAATAFPGDPGVLLEQGRLQGATGQYQQALDSFLAGLEAAPDDPALLKAASLAEARLGQPEAALAHARTLAARPAASGDDLVWLASLLEGAGLGDEAAATYRQALDRQPDNWIALNNLASLLTAGAPEEAVALAERAAGIAPDSAAVRDTLGWAQLQAGQLGPAAQTFEALHAANPDSALLTYRLGVLRQRQGREDEARALLQEALTRDPGFRYAEDARQRLQ